MHNNVKYACIFSNKVTNTTKSSTRKSKFTFHVIAMKTRLHCVYLVYHVLPYLPIFLDIYSRGPSPIKIGRLACN